MAHMAVALMVSVCDVCGKRCYASKRAAKLAGRSVDRRCTGVDQRREVVCSWCGREYALGGAGLVRSHDAGFAMRCEGVGKPPKEEAS